jgi:hypothetical protein
MERRPLCSSKHPPAAEELAGGQGFVPVPYVRIPLKIFLFTFLKTQDAVINA